MANITQKISSYIHGISQQPDHLKRAGQVTDLVNVLPDVTVGCQKRPGSELIAKLETTKGGKWFTIFRDENEKYLVQYVDSTIRVWSLFDGTPRVVKYSTVPFIPDGEGGNQAPVVPPNLPDACNPVRLADTLNAWLTKKSEADAKYNEYVAANNAYEYYAADPIRVTYQAPKIKRYKDSNILESGYYFLYHFWSNKTWKKKDIKSINIPANAGEPVIEPDRYNKVLDPTDRNNSYFNGWWAYPQGYNITTGTYSQAQIDAAQAHANALKVEYESLRAQEEPLRVAYRQEANKCEITNVRSLTAPVDIIPYLNDTEPSDIDILTVNDYTFVTNKRATVTMGKDTTTLRPYEAFIQLKSIEYNSEYKINITAPTSSATVQVPYAKSLSVSPASWKKGDGTCPFTHVQTFDHNDGTKVNLRFELETRGQAVPKNPKDPYSGYDCSYKTYITLLNGGTGWVTGDSFEVTMQGKVYRVTVASHGYSYEFPQLVNLQPYLTPKDSSTGVLKPTDIIHELLKPILDGSTPGWEGKIIGNGAYIKGNGIFTISASGGKTEDAIFAFTNKVNNISKLPSYCKDGYVVKILNTGEHDDDYYVKFIGTEPGVDGTGAWEETIAPGITKNFDFNSMPHILTRQPDGSFLFSPVDWDERQVGDDKTNAPPSFVGHNIQKMMFYRNRLAMLSGENIILSRAGDFFNFWNRTAVTISDDDPIDLSASGTTPTILRSGLALQQGLVLFSDHKQFIFATSQDLLSPQTARLEEVSTYEYNPKTDLIDMGTTIGFLAASGEYARFFEMVGISDFTPEIIEQSKIVPELIKASAVDIAQSKENSIVVLGTRDTKEVQLYRYFNDGTKRIMSSWFKWELTGNLIHHAIDTDKYYLVTEEDGLVVLTKTNLVPTASEYIVTHTKVQYTPRLDTYSVRGEAFVTYDPRTDRSTIRVEHPYDLKRTYVFGLSIDRNQGRVAKALDVAPYSDQMYNIVVVGDWSNSRVAVGYLYEMKVVFPHLFVTKESNDTSVTDTRSYLTIHRGKYQFGAVGMFDMTIEAPSKDTAVHRFEMSPSDAYLANTHEVLPSTFKTVPFYEKNTNLDISLTSYHPTPCTLLSMEWEGKYSTKNYQRV